MGAFLKHLIDRHRELFRDRRVGVVPVHDGLAFEKQVLRPLLNGDYLVYSESGDE